MEKNNRWILESKEAMTLLKGSKLGFLKYENLTYQNSLYDAVKSVNSTMERQLILGWDAFTSGIRDLTIQDFRDVFFTDIDCEEPLLLVTDEGHDNGWVFSFLVKEIFHFAEWYEEYFNREFFEFADYVVIFPSLNTIRFNDDEGGLNEYVVF